MRGDLRIGDEVMLVGGCLVEHRGHLATVLDIESASYIRVRVDTGSDKGNAIWVRDFRPTMLAYGGPR